VNYSYPETSDSQLLMSNGPFVSSQNPDQPKQPDVEFKLSCYRCLILLALFSLSLCSAAVTLCLTAQSKYIASAYGISVVYVNACAIVFTATFIQMFFVSAKMYTDMRISTVLRIGAVILTAGTWIRYLAVVTSTFWPVLVGTTVLSMSAPIILSSVTPVCNKWFGDKERSSVTAILGLAGPVGAILGLACGGLFFLSVSYDTPLETN
jgi:hypothetical protein